VAIPHIETQENMNNRVDNQDEKEGTQNFNHSESGLDKEIYKIEKEWCRIGEWINVVQNAP
jgi:hypothetical protein